VAHRLDFFEKRRTPLLGEHLADQLAKPPDVGSERLVLLLEADPAARHALQCRQAAGARLASTISASISMGRVITA
jgi:hypothetical protein